MINVIKNRKSIRAFKNTPLNEEQIITIKESIQFSPTWKNKQCFEVIAIEDRSTIETIGEMVRYNPGKEVYNNIPLLLVFLADPTKSGNRDEKPYYMADTAIAVTHATLCATSLGLGSCWVGVFPEEALKEYLHVPAHLRIVALLPIGYPDEDPTPLPRRELDNIFHINKY